MASLTSCLWLAPEDAGRAVELWTSVVPGSRVVDELTLTNEDQGEVRTWTLEMAGRQLRVMGGAGGESFTMAHSLWLVVADQAELDQVWDGLLAAGGQELACGWIRDPFGVCWQVLPEAWERLTAGDPARAQRVAEALWQMTKIDVAALETAAEA